MRFVWLNTAPPHRSFHPMTGCVLATLMLSCVLTMRVAEAQSGGYGTPVYSGGTFATTATNNSYRLNTGSSPWIYAYGAYSQADTGGTLSSASCSGDVTATFSWTPSSAPTPAAVIITQQAEAFWNGYPGATGSANNPLGGTNPGKGVAWTATKYSAQSAPPASLAVPCSGLSATATPPAPPNGGAAATRASYQVSVAPVTVKITGTYSTTDYRALTGQQVKVEIIGIPTNTSVTSYTWTISPSTNVFKNYNPALSSNQLIPLGSTDLTGPASGSTTISALNFYDSNAESVTVTCQASLKFPDNTTGSITATSSSITFLKPTGAWAVDPATVTIGGTSVANVIGFHDDSATSHSFGVNTTWYPVTISVPSPFAGGTGCFAQLVEPSASITRTPTGTGAATYTLKIPGPGGTWVTPSTTSFALDYNFPYYNGFTTDASGNLTGTVGIVANGANQEGPYTFSAGSTGASGDDPTGQESATDVDNGGSAWSTAAISDNFTTWLMYQPPGTGSVWVPLMKATWSGHGTASGGPSNWSATGGYTAPSPGNATDFPQWSTIIKGQQYRP